MPRDIDADLQASLESTSRTELLLLFVTVTDPNQVDPLRVVCEENKGVSFANGLPINYILDGELFYGVPFSFARLTDNEQPATGSFTIPAFTTDIGDWLRTMTDPARIRAEIHALSDWDLTVEPVQNARSPIGTPETLYDANHMFARSASGGKSIVTLAVGGYDFTQEPLGQRATADLCPDLFR